MFDVLMTVAFLGILVGLASLILLLVDRFTLRRGLSSEERKAAVNVRTRRWHRRYLFFMFIMALAALFVHTFFAGWETTTERIVFFTMAALFIFWYLSTWKSESDDRR
jgi:L-asparagine transporter-like permease